MLCRRLMLKHQIIIFYFLGSAGVPAAASANMSVGKSFYGKQQQNTLVKPSFTKQSKPPQTPGGTPLRINPITSLTPYQNRSVFPSGPKLMIVTEHSTLKTPDSASCIWMGNPECGVWFLSVECWVTVISLGPGQNGLESRYSSRTITRTNM